uniref:Uncharacterized protein n=1 Tax=Arion vulgaris TaxID=1028688 RepID=A0A0B7BAM1_9EUPU
MNDTTLQGILNISRRDIEYKINRTAGQSKIFVVDAGNFKKYMTYLCPPHHEIFQHEIDKKYKVRDRNHKQDIIL